MYKDTQVPCIFWVALDVSHLPNCVDIETMFTYTVWDCDSSSILSGSSSLPRGAWVSIPGTV